MDFTGHIVGLAKDFGSSLWHLTIEMDKETKPEGLNEFGKDTKLTVRLTKYKKSRSNNANAYLWRLCSDIASHKSIRTTKEEVYLERLFKHPVFETIDGHTVIVTCNEKTDVNLLSVKDDNVHHYYMPVPDSRRYDEQWGWYTQDYLLVRGSSLFDVSEMSSLLEDVIEEAKGLGIPTETDAEKQKLLDKWAKDYERTHKHHN